MKQLSFFIILLAFSSVVAQKESINPFQTKYILPSPDLSDCGDYGGCTVKGKPYEVVKTPLLGFIMTNWYLDCPCFGESKIIWKDLNSDYFVFEISEVRVVENGFEYYEPQLIKRYVDIVFREWEKPGEQ